MTLVQLLLVLAWEAIDMKVVPGDLHCPMKTGMMFRFHVFRPECLLCQVLMFSLQPLQLVDVELLITNHLAHLDGDAPECTQTLKRQHQHDTRCHAPIQEILKQRKKTLQVAGGAFVRISSKIRLVPQAQVPGPRV